MIYIREGEAPFTIRIQNTLLYLTDYEPTKVELKLINTTTRETIVLTPDYTVGSYYEVSFNVNLGTGEWEYTFTLYSEDEGLSETGLLYVLGDNDKIIEYNG